MHGKNLNNFIRTLFCLSLTVSTVFAQGYWSQRYGQAGTNNNVPQTLTVGSDGTVYIGGGFDYAFGVKTSYFARWNPATGWDSIPGRFTGSSFPINSVVTGNGNDVYVAGGFSGVGTLAKRGIVKWNGIGWDSIPGSYSMASFSAPSKIVYANGKLYAIGSFQKAGAIPVNGIAVWDGVKWDSLGSLQLANSNSSSKNNAFTVTADGRIYAATYAINTWGKENVAIVKWSGTKWDTVAKDLMGDAGGADGYSAKARVRDIAVHGDTLYVVGAFSKAGNKIANCIAKWDGAKWDSLGNGSFTEITNVEIDSLGRVYAAGRTAPYEGNSSFGAVSRWNGTKWERLGTGITKSQYGQSPVVWEMKIAGSILYLCGDFKEPGGIAATGAVRYNIAASQWQPLHGKNSNGFADGAVFAVHERSNGEIFVGGEFNFAGPTNARRLARWNGKTWDSVGTGSFKNTSTVRALGSDDSVLYVGGGFTSFNGINSAGVIKWNGQQFVSMNGAGQPGSFSSDVRAIARYGSSIIVAGSFQSYFGTFPSGKTVNSIVRWTGTKWDSLDGGIQKGSSAGIINTMTVKNNDLYVAGNFTAAGTVNASSIAKWNGTQWNNLSGDLIRYNKSVASANITAMAFVGNDLYIAGKFDSIGTKPMWHLARWNGSQWDSVSLGLMNNTSGIADMAVDKRGRLYITGAFASVGGNTEVKYVARWNGAQWEKLGTATSSFQQDMFMAESDGRGNIYFSGYFGYVDGYSSQNFAVYVNDAGPLESVRQRRSSDALDGFELAQNYPNPFNPATTISYSIHHSIAGEVVSLRVYDVLGRETATLVNERKDAGRYTVRFDASSLASGIYFYQLRAGKYTETKRMLFVK